MPATAAQTIANQKNATHSTGPRTPEGKARSARNATRFGLFTAHDFVLPDERELYDAFCLEFLNDLYPEGPLEHTHALEIIRASWRLQRCAKIEATLADQALEAALDNAPLDPIAYDAKNEAATRTQLAVDRARTQANTTIRRATAELRRIQTNRQIAASTCEDPNALGILPDQKHIIDTLHAEERAKFAARKMQNLHTIDGILEYTDNQRTQRYTPTPQPAVTAASATAHANAA